MSSGIALLASIAAVVLLAVCAPPGICEDFDTAEHTNHFVISEARGAAIAAAAADGGTGRPTCVEECLAMPHTGNTAGACSVGGPADGGVTLTCEFHDVCL